MSNNDYIPDHVEYYLTYISADHKLTRTHKILPDGSVMFYSSKDKIWIESNYPKWALRAKSHLMSEEEVFLLSL